MTVPKKPFITGKYKPNSNGHTEYPSNRFNSAFKVERDVKSGASVGSRSYCFILSKRRACNSSVLVMLMLLRILAIQMSRGCLSGLK